jgi:hypothetical protein
MTQTAALTQEERAEIRALCERMRKIGTGPLNRFPFALDAANGIARLLDALEAAERERDEALRMLSPGEAS